MIRGFAILMVLAVHTDLFKQFLLGDLFYNFAVPTFIFLSSLCLTLRYRDIKISSLSQFFKKRFQYLLPGYFIWGFLYYYIRYCIIWGESFVLMFYKYITSVIVGDVLTIYFLFALFQLYLLYPYFLKIFKTLSLEKRSLVVILSFVLITLLYIFSLFSPILLLQSKIPLFDLNLSKLFFFIMMLPFFFLGMAIAFNYEDFKKIMYNPKTMKFISSIYLSSLIILYLFQKQYQKHIYRIYGYNNYYNFVMLYYSLISILFYYCLFIRFESDLLYKNSQFSSGLFLAHRTIMVSFVVLIPLLFNIKYSYISSILYGIPFFLMVLFGTLLITSLIKQLPYSRYIIK